MILLPGAEFSYRARAKAHPVVIYKGLRVEFDLFDEGGRVLHIICPRCTKYGLLAETNKRFEIDDRGRLTIFQPFGCDYCFSRFVVTDGLMRDA